MALLIICIIAIYALLLLFIYSAGKANKQLEKISAHHFKEKMDALTTDIIF